MASAYDVASAFRARVLAADADAARALIRGYATGYARLEGDALALAAEIGKLRERGEVVSPARLRRLKRYEALGSQLQDELTRLSALAEDVIAGGQAAAVDLGADAALRTTLAALPPGTTERVLASANLSWNRLPAAALQQLVGQASDGSPLRALLDELPAYVGRGIEEKLVAGLARGSNPAKIAREIRDGYGVGLARSLAISRTEVLRSFRESTRRTYAQNPALVKGYRRIADLSDRTCAACLSLHLAEYEVADEPDNHVSCRCGIVPITPSWRELGVDMDEPESGRETGAQWFSRQDAGTKRKVLGPGGYELFEAGTPLNAWVQVDDDPRWGRSARVAPLEKVRAA